MDSAMKFFYANGGADCYIMSVGGYDATPSASDITAAIDLLKKETEPTMLLVPDAIELSAKNNTEAYVVLSKMINHCGEDMPSRVAILDVPGGYSNAIGTPIVDFRNNVNPILPKSNSYAAAYYPWLHTGIYQSTDIAPQNLSAAALAILATKITAEFPKPKPTVPPSIEDKAHDNVVKMITTLTTALTPVKKVKHLRQHKKLPRMTFKKQMPQLG